MKAALTGIFNTQNAAQRAMADLRAAGFDEEAVSDLPRDDYPATGPGSRGFKPAVSIINSLILGGVIGGICGLIADWFLGMRLTWPAFNYAHTFWAAIFTLAAPGAIAGALIAIGYVGRLSAASRVLAERRRSDALVMVFADTADSGRAMDILRAAGAEAVRAGSAPTTTAQPIRESVEAPISTTSSINLGGSPD